MLRTAYSLLFLNSKENGQMVKGLRILQFRVREFEFQNPFLQLIAEHYKVKL